MIQQIGATVESMREEIASFLQRMVQIPSENPPGNYVEITDFLNEELQRLGFSVEVVKVPDERTRAEGLETPRRNLIASLKGEGEGPHLIFNAHIDTVPAGDPEQWTYPPFSGAMADGRIYGRGATDSKGRLAAYIMAAVALKRSGVPLHGSITIAATCDEETGGKLGAGYVTENNLVHGDVVIVEGYSNQIVRAMAGVLQLKITSKGKPAHAGFKWKGINAVEKIAKVVQGLSELQEQLKQEPSSIPGMRYTTVNVGVIQGGTKVNVVPGSCEIEVDFRVIPEHSLEEIYDRVQSLIANLKQSDPEMNVDIQRLSFFETEPTVVSEDSQLIDKLQRSVEDVTGVPLPVVGMLGQTDLRWFIKSGIQGINFGPGTNDNNLHGYDEFMDLEDLIETTKILALLAGKLVSESVNR